LILRRKKKGAELLSYGHFLETFFYITVIQLLLLSVVV